MRHAITAAAVASVLAAGLAPQAFANQLDALLLPATDRSVAHLTAYRTIKLGYPQDSAIAELLDGRSERIDFLADSTSQEVRTVLEKINGVMRSERKSAFTLENATVQYVAMMEGYPDGAQLSYKVDIKADVTGYVLQKANGTGPAIVDLDWRNFEVKDPLVVSTERGAIDINRPSGALKAVAPELAEKLLAGEAGEIMEDPIMDFGRFDLPMQSWHFLFDVTGEQLKNYDVFVEGQGGTVSIHSIGESSFREGRYRPEEKEAVATVDGTAVAVHASTPSPSGQISIAGYSKAEERNGTEYALVSSKAPWFVIGFQFQVLLVLGGMMGAIAVFVLFKTRR